MAKIIAFSNQKGGVGKTTSCVNIAADMGKSGKKVLVVDLDPQGNATSGLGIAKKTVKHSVYEMICGDCTAAEAILPTKCKNLSVIPSTVDLAGAEVDLQTPEGQGRNALHGLDEVGDRFDYILIDCPPSLGLLTINALSYANGVIIPMQCEFFALEGLSQLLITIKRVRRAYNPDLEMTGLLLTMFNGRLSLTKQVVDELKKYYPDKIFKTPISRSVRLSEAPSYGAPICYYDPHGKCAEEYHQVAREIIALG